MSLNVTLGQILTDLRAHIGGSANPAQMQSFDSVMRSKLARVQEWLYNEWEWEHLLLYNDETILPGGRYYSFNSEFNFERINGVWIYYPTLWRDVSYGITPEQYNYSNPDLGVRSDPVLRWSHYTQVGDDPSIGQFEVWPVPASQQKLRFRCIRKLRPFIADTDRADLDDKLIVLFTAAEILKQKKSSDAADMLAMAQRLFVKLKGQNNKIGMFIMGNGIPTSTHADWKIRIRGT